MKAITVLRLLRAIHTPGLGLSPSQMHILAELAHRPGIAMLDLGRRCRRPGRGIERPVGVLQRLGYIDKTAVGRPRAPNAALLTLTPLGLELLRGLETAVTEPTTKSN